MKTRALLGLCVSVGLLALPVGASSAAAAQPKLPGFTPRQVDGQAALRHPAVLNDASILSATAKLKTFTASVVDSGKTYKYTIVGKNPAIASTAASTTIKTLIVPLNIIFTGLANWDPTVADNCDTGTSSLVRAQKSPIVNPQPYTWGSAAIGSAQYVDAFQRAQFWTYAKPTGINPNYHVKLQVSTLPTVNVVVPPTKAATHAILCGNKLLGAVEINWLDAYLQTTVIPSLASSGVGANTFPIFLLHNVVEFIGTPATCCALGYHNAYKRTSTSPMQTYGVADYDNSRRVLRPGGCISAGA